MPSFLIDECIALSTINNGAITYTPPSDVSADLPACQRYPGTIATYSCSPGYQLVGGSSLRACGPDGIWNGTEPFCSEFVANQLYHTLTPFMFS